MEDHESRDSISFRLLFFTLIMLLSLTALTVLVSKSYSGPYRIFTALTIASVKGVLVLWFFMQLRGAGRLVITGFISTIVILATLIALTFLDIAYR